jgi:hypothetical protein
VILHTKYTGRSENDVVIHGQARRGLCRARPGLGRRAGAIGLPAKLQPCAGNKFNKLTLLLLVELSASQHCFTLAEWSEQEHTAGARYAPAPVLASPCALALAYVCG